MSSVGRLRIRVISPCYNEMDGIPDFIAGIESVRASLDDVDLDLLLVDDGSMEDTPIILRGAASGRPWIHVISLTRNFLLRA